LPQLLGKINLNMKVKSDLCDAVKSMPLDFEVQLKTLVHLVEGSDICDEKENTGTIGHD